MHSGYDGPPGITICNHLGYGAMRQPQLPPFARRDLVFSLHMLGEFAALRLLPVFAIVEEVAEFPFRYAFERSRHG